jgi:N-acetylglucosamine malate deacetylase 1
MNILAFGAHPDDIKIFMYGFFALCKKRGDTIHLAIATDGSGGIVETSEDLIQVRKKETIQGLERIGRPVFFDFPDGQLSFTLGATAKIDSFIKKIKPDLILTHSPEDYHPDHRALSKIVSDSTGFQCPVLFADSLMGVGFIPEFYVDITNLFEDKKNAIAAHKSQRPEKFIAGVTILNGFRSAQCNGPISSYAEAYRVDKRFPFTDIRSLIPAGPIYRPFYSQNSDGLL